jgi:outer membrane protein, adhesin transport system
MVSAFWPAAVTADAGLTLPAAVLRGLARHPEVRSAEAEAAMAATEVDLARNAYLPTLGGSAGPAAAGVGYDITLSQTLHDFGVASSQVDRARALLARQEANVRVVRDDVALEIAEIYLDIASSRVQLALVDEHIARLAAYAETARDRVESRYSDRAETGRVALALSTAQGLKAGLQGRLAEASSTYALLIDQPAVGLRLPEPPTFLDELRPEGALETAVEGSPLYQRAALAATVAEANIREARASRLPRLALEGSIQRREIGGRMVDDAAVGLRLRFTPQQGLSSLQRPQLEAQRRAAALLAADAVGQDLRRLVSSLAAQDLALSARIEALSDQADQSRALGEVYREQFLVGRRDIQDLVGMETQYFESERQIVELTVERLRLQYRVAAQLGLMTPSMSGDQMQQPLSTQP